MNKRVAAALVVFGLAVSGIFLLQSGEQQTPRDELSAYEDQLDELESFLDFLESWENIDLSDIEGLQ
ncbi:MAG TPA: hypothetical protein ENF64_00330 [Hadesarchaea archaeon]|nr:hypothetical protein [Hadesarchaea archaeon]